MCALNVGSQEISLKYGAPGNSSEINERFLNTHPAGIYTGGLLIVSDGLHAIVSPLVCEISDGTYQVRVQTTINVTLAVASASPYVVLRWSYTGDTADYMELLALASGSVVASTDVVVGKCVFTAGSLTGFDYGDSTFSRTVPSTHDLYLEVVPSVGTTLKALVMPGWTQGQQEKTFVPMQETSALVAPVFNPKIYLVVLSEDGVVSIDSTGVEAAVPVAPSYNGRNILAEITLSPGDTSITSTKIQDVRMFVSGHAPSPDGVTIITNATGNLETRAPVYNVSRTIGPQLSNLAAWTPLTIQGTTKYSGLAPVNLGVYTLPAGRLYKISYSISFKALSLSPIFEVRLHVISGDISWGFADDDFNVSWQKHGSVAANDFVTSSGTYLILPASVTTMMLEVKTRNVNGHYGDVEYATVSIWAE